MVPKRQESDASPQDHVAVHSVDADETAATSDAAVCPHVTACRAFATVPIRDRVVLQAPGALDVRRRPVVGVGFCRVTPSHFGQFGSFSRQVSVSAQLTDSDTIHGNVLRSVVCAAKPRVCNNFGVHIEPERDDALCGAMT